MGSRPSIGRSSQDSFSRGTDSILSRLQNKTAHHHLVSGPSPFDGSLAADCSISSVFTVPKGLAWPLGMFPPQLGSFEHKKFPAIRWCSRKQPRKAATTSRNPLGPTVSGSSNCSTRLALQWNSLRDLDCTHSNYQTLNARYCYLLSLPPRIRIG